MFPGRRLLRFEAACRKAAGVNYVPPISETKIDPPRDGWKHHIKLYFPSNTDIRHDSLLELDATYGVKPNGEGRFHSYFSYTAKPYEGRDKGNPDDVTYAAEFPADATYLAAQFAESVGKGPMKLGPKGEFQFTVGKADKYYPAQMDLTFTDKKGEMVGRFGMTVLSPVINRY